MYYGNGYQGRGGKTSSKVYVEARIQASELARSVRLGKSYEDIMGEVTAKRRRQRQSNAMTGRKHTAESILRMKKPKYEGFGARLSKATKGRKFSESHLDKLRVKERPLLQMDGNLVPIRVWRSTRVMSKALGIHASNVAGAIKRGIKCGGYRWDYF